MTYDTLGPVDAIWLNSDHPENLMVIDCLVLLDGPVDRDRLERVVGERLVERYPVFSRRPAAAASFGGRPRWREVPGFRLADHLHTVVLDSPVDDAALREYVERFVGTPMPRDRPLWQLHLIEGQGERTAIFVRLHHALADGIALTRVLLSITDAAADIDVADPDFDPVSSRPGAARTSIRSVLGRGWTKLLDAPVLARLAALPTLLLRGGGVLSKILLTRNPVTVW